MRTRIVLSAALALASLGLARAQDNKMVWRATAADIKGACRVGQIAEAQEEFKKKNGIYAKQLSMLADHSLISKETASGVHDGFRFALESDEKSFTVRGRPANEEQGVRTFMVKNGKKIRSAFAKDAGDTDQKVSVAIFEVQANKDWQSCALSVNDKQEVHYAVEGQWKIGGNWKPCGPGGSTEKSVMDYRMYTNKEKTTLVGCLVARIEGQDGAFCWGKDDKEATFVAPKAGSLQFRCNCKGNEVPGVTGKMTVYVLVMHPFAKEDD